MKAINAQHQPVTLERLERGLVVAAYLMELHGPVRAPIFERLEREIAAMRADQDAVGRAKRLLESYRTAGGVKAPGLIDVDGPNIRCAPSWMGEAA